MPVMDARYRAVPRVLMNIWWNDNGVALPGVTTFLPKPFTVDTLLYTMQRYVR